MKRYFEEIISKKPMKRILAVILALSLVCTMFNTSMFETDASNLVQTETFENGIGASDMKQGAYSLYDSSTAGYSADNVYGGEKSLKMSAGFDNGGGFSKYRPQTNIQLEKGKTYKVSFWYKATATTVGATDYKTKSLFIFEINGNAYSERMYIKHTDGVWKKFEKTYTVTNTLNVAENAVTAQFLSYAHVTDAYEVYIDDIVIGEAVTVAAANDGNGTALVNGETSITAYANETVTYEATANEGYEFVGWKNSAGGVVSTEATYTHVVTEGLTLTAHFAKNIRQYEDFEGGISSSDMKQGAYSLYESTGTQDENVHGGEKSLKMSAGYDNGGGFSKYRPQTNILLEKGKTYKVSFWYKATATTVGSTDYKTKSLFVFEINGNAYSERTYIKHTDGEWKKFEKIYTVTNTLNVAENAVTAQFLSYAHVTGAYEVYIDDIVIGEAITVSAANDGNGSALVNGDLSITAYTNDTVTYVATPNSGYSFVGWKNAAGEVVSTEATYSCVVTEDMALTACFKNSLLKVEDFESGIGSSDMKQGAYSLYEATGTQDENVHGGEKSLKISAGVGDLSKYRPQTNIQLEKGKTYNVSFWYKATAETVSGTDYKTKSLFIFEINGNATSERTWLTHTNGEWKKFEKVYTVTNTLNVAENAVTAQFLSYKHVADAYEVYIDDISVSEVVIQTVTVTASASANGNASVDGTNKVSVDAGTSVKFTAVANEGYVFDCWKTADGTTISNAAEYTHTATEDISLTAYFKKTPDNTQTFEWGDMGDNLGTGFSVYNADVAGYETDNVHGGSASLLADSVGSMKNYLTEGSIKLEKGKTYEVSFWYKASSTLDDNAALLYYRPRNTANTSYTGTQDYIRSNSSSNGQWQQVKKYYTIGEEDTCLQFTTYGDANKPAGSFKVFIDDITAVEIENVNVSASVQGNGSATVGGKTSTVAVKNQPITFKATPDEGYVFECWKDSAGSIISYQAEYTPVITEETHLTAYFVKAREMDNTQNFELGVTGDTLSSAFRLYNAVLNDYNSANVHEGGASLKATPTGSFTSYVTKGSIVLKAGKTYKVTFWYKATTTGLAANAALLYFQPNGADYGVDRQYLRTTNGEWVEQSVFFTAGSTDTYLQFTAYDKAVGSFEAYIDDIKAVEVTAVKVSATANANGTATVDGKASTSAVVGEKITFKAAPNEGYAFDCWKDSAGNAVSYLPEYSPVITDELHLTAYFKKSKVSDNIQDFEYGLMDDKIQKGFTLYNSQNPGADASNVHGGNASLQFIADGEWRSYYPEKSIVLKSGKYYKVSYWYKATTDTLADNATVFFVQPKGTAYSDGREYLRITKGEWTYKEAIIYISGDDTTLAFTAYNKAAGSFEVYLDDIKAIELSKKPVNIAVKAEGNGSATVNGVSSIYLEQGNEAKLVGTPKAGYYLTCWKDSVGNIVSYDNEFTLKNLQADNTYTACFAPVKQPTGKLDFESKPSDRMQRQFTWYNPLSEGYSKKNVKNGNGSLKVTADGNWGNYWADTSIVLKANTSYDISFWYKAESTKTSTILFFKTNIEENQDNRIYLSATKGAWVLKKATIKTGAQDTYLQMILFNVDAGSTVMYFDDIVAQKTNLYKEIPAVQTESFDEQCIENAYGSWNSDKRYTRNGSAGSIKMDGSAVTDGHGSYFYTNFEVEPFTKYKASVWIYCVSSDYSTGQAQLYSPFGTVYSELKKQVGEWKEISFTFDSGNITTNVLQLALIVRQGVLYYADDLTLTKLDYEGSYGENLYNLYKEGSLESFSDSIWSELPSNFVRTEATDKASANSGKYYLLTDGEGTYTRKITIDKVGRYALAASFLNIKNGDVKIEILKDGKALSRIIQNEAGMLLSTDSNEWARQLLLFDNTEENAEFEVRITSNGGKTAIDDISLFYAKYLKNEDPNDYRDYADNIEVVSYAVDVSEDNQNDMSSDKIIGIIIIAGAVVALAAIGVGITVMRAKKRREEHEKADN